MPIQDPKKFQVRIESILGGHSPTTHFAALDQFRTSIGIDPSLPIDDGLNTLLGSAPSGLLRPMSMYNAGTTFGVPMWIDGNPKEEGTLYAYDSVGSVYTINDGITTVTGLGDLNDGMTARGNGMEYYDNYMYFATSTTIARYGPLDGTPTFTDDYWVTTLGKTALTNTTYPSDFDFLNSYPNHVMHRHSDGRLYIADVVGNQGTIHYIQTSKTSVEGDTDNGSTYNKVQVGYGLWPIAMESYGTNLVIAFIELKVASGSRTLKTTRAKLAFWDTTSQNINQITWVEYPDQMITALKNVNGVLYVASGNQYVEGFRVTRFIGGYTFEDVAFVEQGQPPFPGAIDGTAQRLLFGTWTSSTPDTGGCVYSFNLQKAVGNGIFNVVSAIGVNADGLYTKQNVIVTSLKIADSSYGTLLQNYPVLGIGQATKNHAIAGLGAYNGPSTFWSQTFRVGQPFKITKVRIPLAQTIAANMIVTPKIYTDDGAGTTYTGGSSNGLSVINNANYSGKRSVVMRPENLTGDHNFWLELKWTGTVLCVVGLPIIIEYELIPE